MRKYLSRLIFVLWGAYCLYVWFFDRHENFWLNFWVGAYGGLYGVVQAIELKPIRFGIAKINPPNLDEFNTWCYWFTAAMAFVFLIYGAWNLNT